MQERKIIQGAFVVSLLLHLVLAALTWRLPLYPAAEPAQAAGSEREIEMVILPQEEPDSQPEESEMPRAITQIPDRMASEVPPEDPDYLAMHHSLAADNKLGGDSDTPSADQEWVAEQVEIRKEALDGGEGVTFTEQVPPPPSLQGAPAAGEGLDGQEQEQRESDPSGSRGTWALRQPETGSRGEEAPQDREPAGVERPQFEQWWADQQPTILKQGQEGESGDRGFDFSQFARGKVTSGVAFNENYSLNTYAWEWMPWMHRFISDLYRNWVPPYAYRYGIISGMTQLHLVVARDGRIRSLEVMETEGHESLHEASTAALMAFAPYIPLPEGFPEENLEITLGLYYPARPR